MIILSAAGTSRSNVRPYTQTPAFIFGFGNDYCKEPEIHGI